jgi:polyisoprenoid-binding protein YceI
MLTKNLSGIFILILISTLSATGLKQYKIDTNHSNVGFAVSIMGGLSEVHGKFSDFNVELFTDEKDITKSKVKAVIKTTSIDTGINGRDEHLRTEDFFDTEKFPEIIFESSKIEKNGSGFIATGNFTMHGVTKEIKLPFRIVGEKKDEKERKKNIGYVAELEINRKDYGINWEHSSVPNFIGDNVKVKIQLLTRVVRF